RHTACPSSFFTDTATTEIYTLSLHDALPISHTHTHTHTHTHSTGSPADHTRSEEHTSELQSHLNLVCRLLLAKMTQAAMPGALAVCVCRAVPDSAVRRGL